jgi:PadR family transcriptional regulator PadR
MVADSYYFTLGLEQHNYLTAYLRMTKATQRDLFPGALEMMILRTLQRQPLHGYALAQHIQRTSQDLLQIEEGSLYPALQRLLKQRFVKAGWGTSSTNRRVRIYKLTAAGAKHLEHEVSSFERMFEGITRVLAPGES